MWAKPKKLILLGLAAVAVLLSEAVASHAEDDGFIWGDPRWYYTENLNEFSVELFDDVSDGCWTTTQTSKNSVELELIRSGAKIKESYPTTRAVIAISAFGYGTNEYNCAVYAEIEVWAVGNTRIERDEHTVYALQKSRLWSLGSLLTGPKSDMSQRVSSTHEDLIKAFLVTLSKEANTFRETLVKNVTDDSRDFWRLELEK